MKKSLFVRALLLAISVGSFREAAGQTVIDQMVIDNINTRRKAEIYRSRRAPTKSSAAVGARGASTNRATGTSRTAAPTAAVYFGMDMYQQLLPEDPKGFVVHFGFTPASGSAFRRTYNYVEREGRRNAKFTDIPKGVYNVTAQAMFPDGRSRRVHLGTEIGEPTNPTGGRFAPSITIAVGAGKDYYGNSAVVASPESVYIRVLN